MVNLVGECTAARGHPNHYTVIIRVAIAQQAARISEMDLLAKFNKLFVTIFVVSAIVNKHRLNKKNNRTVLQQL